MSENIMDSPFGEATQPKKNYQERYGKYAAAAHERDRQEELAKQVVDWDNPGLREFLTMWIREGISIGGLSAAQMKELKLDYDKLKSKDLTDDLLQKALMTRVKQKIGENYEHIYFEFGPLFPEAFSGYQRKKQKEQDEQKKAEQRQAQQDLAKEREEKIKNKLDRIFRGESSVLVVEGIDGHPLTFRFGEILMKAVKFFQPISYELAMSLPDEIKLAEDDIKLIRAKAKLGFNNFMIMPAAPQIKVQDKKDNYFRRRFGIDNRDSGNEDTAIKHIDDDRPSNQPYLIMIKDGPTIPKSDLITSYDRTDGYKTLGKKEKFMNLFEYACFWQVQDAKGNADPDSLIYDTSILEIPSYLGREILVTDIRKNSRDGLVVRAVSLPKKEIMYKPDNGGRKVVVIPIKSK